MTGDEKKEFKQLIKEGSLEALGSVEGQGAIVDALKSDDGKKAVKEGTLEALRSEQGKKAIKDGALEAFKSDEGKEVFLEYFVDAFHDVVVPVLEKHEERMERIERKVGLVH